ncbi:MULTISPECIES: prephenate dehydrogenase/arogenate dehydrogenase family protein [unclassified Haladaptatus]|uniref:prephenate dehydrogenase/arogenate dehydrogenase family protein n=1 Tax=unclassified Haladaptatus TaxID=2622732 RepID=UPI0023E7A097|nr:MULTISPECIES: prephenate dehydrogenase/arogenate dehydrogenase family protein [unclassified Haladaptatus]
MELLVVGAGAMGRWFAQSVADEWEITFADTDPAAATAAAESVGGDTVSLAADDQFDVVCVAVPMSVVGRAIEAHAQKATAALLDLSGVMETPLAVMAEHAPDAERVSLHPLFGPDNAPGTIAAVSQTGGPVTETLIQLLEAAGNTIFETTAREHDEAMETVQAKAHAAILAFALAAEEVPAEFHTPISAGLFDLVSQVTAGTPRVYAEIQETFEGAADVAEAARRIAESDAAGVEALYRESRR